MLQTKSGYFIISGDMTLHLLCWQGTVTHECEHFRYNSIIEVRKLMFIF
jgi:hypothetical protein